MLKLKKKSDRVIKCKATGTCFTMTSIYNYYYKFDLNMLQLMSNKISIPPAQ